MLFKFERPEQSNRKTAEKKIQKKQRHSKRTDTENWRKAAGSPENTKQVTTQQTC
jgi:hypothetical protein